jgi:hypothetical protein
MGKLAWDTTLKGGSSYHIEFHYDENFYKVYVDNQEIAKIKITREDVTVPFRLSETQCTLEIKWYHKSHKNKVVLYIDKAESPSKLIDRSAKADFPKWAYLFIIVCMSLVGSGELLGLILGIVGASSIYWFAGEIQYSSWQRFIGCILITFGAWGILWMIIS